MNDYVRNSMRCRACAALVVFFFLANAGLASAVAIRTVVIEGESAPGMGNDVTFGIVGPPVLDEFGRTAFKSRLQGPGVSQFNDSVWSEVNGLHLVDQTNDGLPFNYFIAISDVGHTQYTSSLTGIWTEYNGVLTNTVPLGQEVPGIPGANLSYLRYQHPVINASGQTAFSGILAGGGVNSWDRRGLWSTGGDSLHLVARESLRPPTGPFESAVGSLITDGVPVINDHGETAFLARGWVISGDLTFITNGLWTNRGGDLHVIAVELAAPGGSSPVPVVGSFGLHVSINNQGQTAFVAGDSLWSEGGGSLHRVATPGTPAPGTEAGINFDSFNWGNPPMLNGNGLVAFRNGLVGPGITTLNDEGIWRGLGPELDLIAREGAPAPLPGGDLVFGDLGLPAINGRGHVAFTAYLSGPNRGGYAILVDGANGLEALVQVGEILEVAPGDFRTVSNFEFNRFESGGNEDGRPCIFNDHDQLTFLATFTDGTQGIFVASLDAVPEPSAWTLLFAQAVALWLFRRRQTKSLGRR